MLPGWSARSTACRRQDSKSPASRSGRRASIARAGSVTHPGAAARRRRGSRRTPRPSDRRQPARDGHRITHILRFDFDDERFEVRLMVERAPSAVRCGEPALQRVSRKQMACGIVRTRGNAEVLMHPRLTHGTGRRDRTEAEVNAATSRIRPHVRGHRFYNPSTAHRTWSFDYDQGRPACVRIRCGPGAGFLDTSAPSAAPRSS